MPRKPLPANELNAPGHKILLCLARHHALTADQVTYLLFAPSSLTYAYENLHRLVRQGFVKSQHNREKGGGMVWYLAEKGVRYVHELGFVPDKRIHHALRPAGMQINHRIAVNWVLIQLEKSPYPILEHQNEWQLSRHATKLTLTDGTSANYAPDAWVRMNLPRGEASIVFEVDRGTEDPSVWRHKVHQMVSFTSKDQNGSYPFASVFGVERMRFAVVAVDGPPDVRPKEIRFANLKHWTELELKKLGKERWADLFYFTFCDPKTISGEELLTGAGWQHPFSGDFVPLTEGLL